MDDHDRTAPGPTARGRAPVIRRGLAYLLDAMLAFTVVALGQLLLLPVRTAVGIDEAWFHSGPNTQLWTLLVISVPTWLLFALPERATWRATPGKRLLGLCTTWSGPEPPGWGRAIARAVVKLLPWEVAHLANNLPVPVWYAEDPGFRVGFALVPVLMLVYAAMAATGEGRTPHDRLAGTAVVRAPDGS